MAQLARISSNLGQFGTTRRKLCATFGDTINAPNETKVSDMAAMCGGSFYIGPQNKGILLQLLARHQAAGDYQLALVPTIGDSMTILFADIDHAPSDFDINLFLQRFAAKFNEIAASKVKEAHDVDVIMFKREDAKRYHAYIPAEFGEVTKAERKAIAESINEEYGAEIIDKSANTIRFEGFQKFDPRVAKAFIPGSRYLPIGAAQTLSYDELLDRVWLNPRGWMIRDDESVLDYQLGLEAQLVLAAARDIEDKEEHFPEAVPRNEDDEKSQSEHLASRGLTRNNSSLSSVLEAPPRESSVNAMNKSIKPDVEEKIKGYCPEIAHVALTYPVVSFKKRDGHVTMILDKSIAGRTCKIAGGIHSSSNTYLYYNQKSKILYQKCFSSKCVNKKGVVITKLRANRSVISNKNDELPTADEASIARQFILFQPLTRVERDGKKVFWYIFDEDVGYWKKRVTDAVMRSIMEPFRIWLEAKFIKAADETSGDCDDIMSTATEIDKMLKRTRDLKGVAECIRWSLTSTEKIEWNSKPDYTVFPNGVLQVDKRDKTYPELYFFGPTKPEEYINDARVMRRPFNCPPLCNDGHYITQANILLNDWILLVQPNAEDRRLLLTFVSLSFKAINYKKMIINIGHAGDNAKSSFFEMIIYALADYGVTGDKCLIVKGKKDRVSKASLNEARFVLFEEPDPSKPLDIEFLKDIVGGARKTAGRYNFSNDNVIRLDCKTVLNANTMTSVQLENAIMNRLLFLAWLTVFTNNPNDVNHDKRIYLADEKFKTEKYFDAAYDGLIWLMLNHYRIYDNDGFKLAVSDRQLRRTRAKLMDNDLFIRWFKANYIFLADTESNRKKFITQEEVIAEFAKLTPTQHQQIIGRRNYQPDKYVKDMLQIHSAFKSCFEIKVTNWRLTMVERHLPAARNKTGPNKQYMGNVLIRFVTRAEFESAEPGHYQTADLSMNDQADKRSYIMNDGEDDDENVDVFADDSEVPADYLHAEGLFFNFKIRSSELNILNTDDEADEQLMNDEGAGDQLMNDEVIDDFGLGPGKAPAKTGIAEIEQQLKATSVDLINIEEDKDEIDVEMINDDNNGSDDVVDDDNDGNNDDKAGDVAIDVNNDKAEDHIAGDNNVDEAEDKAMDVDNDKAEDESKDANDDKAGDEAEDADNAATNNDLNDNDKGNEEAVNNQPAQPIRKSKRKRAKKSVNVVYKASKYAPAKKKRKRT